MKLTELVNNALNDTKEISGREIDKIISNPEFNKYKSEVVDSIESNLEYPNLNALKFASMLPDEKYEKKLLSYEAEDMTDEQVVYWMFSLSEIKSEKGFGKINKFTETSLFHQAFTAMAKIDLSKTLILLEKYIDKNCHLFKESKLNESGYNALFNILIGHDDPEEAISDYDLSDENKKALVNEALESAKSYKFL